MWSFIQTNAIINYFNRHAHCGISASVAIYISKRPSRIYINASHFTKASHLSGRMVPRCPKKKRRNVITKPAQRPPASQEKRPLSKSSLPLINPRSLGLGILCSVSYSRSILQLCIIAWLHCTVSPFCATAGLHLCRKRMHVRRHIAPI